MSKTVTALKLPHPLPWADISSRRNLPKAWRRWGSDTVTVRRCARIQRSHIIREISWKEMYTGGRGCGLSGGSDGFGGRRCRDCAPPRSSGHKSGIVAASFTAAVSCERCVPPLARLLAVAEPCSALLRAANCRPSLSSLPLRTLTVRKGGQT